MNSEQRLTMIQRLSDAYGVSGFEDQAIAEARRWIDSERYVIAEDHMRNLIIKPKAFGGEVKVLLDAHSDELGFMVQAIKPNGTLTFLPLGGWAANNVSAHKVKVRNRQGEYISGIVAAKPVHFMTERERHAASDISTMVIDVGSRSFEETRDIFQIDIGAPVVPDVACEIQHERGLVVGTALDCRIGVAALLETLDQIDPAGHRNAVCACLSSQEEVGDRGIQTALHQLEADVAIVFEGCPADDTFTEDWLCQTAMGKGPMLRHMDRSIIANPRWMRQVLDLAHQRQIPVQESVRSGGGNNGAMIQLSQRGIPTVVLGIPVRYIHSHHGIASLADVEAAVALAKAVIDTVTAADVAGL